MKEVFKPASGLPEGHYDVLIVGSGMGGLTAALLLGDREVAEKAAAGLEEARP